MSGEKQHPAVARSWAAADVVFGVVGPWIGFVLIIGLPALFGLHALISAAVDDGPERREPCFPCPCP